MNTHLKVILYIGAFVAFLFIGNAIFEYVSDNFLNKNRLHEELVNSEKEFKKLSDYTASLELKYVQEKLLKEEAERRFSKDSKTLKGRIKILSDVVVSLNEKARIETTPDGVFKDPKDKNSFVMSEIRYENGPPLGYVLFYKDGRTVSKLYPHEFKVDTAVSRNEKSGEYVIISKANYTLKSPSLKTSDESWENKPFNIPVSGGVALIDPTEKNLLKKRLHLWAPHVNGGSTFGFDKKGPMFRPTLDVSLMGYGVTKNDLDWKFLHFGVSLDTRFKNTGVIFTPASYRFWPSLLSNSYLGPSVGYTFGGGGFSGGLNLNITF